MANEWDIAQFEALIQPLWGYLSVSDSPFPADVIFVFGCRDLAVPARASELYSDGYASRVLLTGSFGRMTQGVFEKEEALVFEDYLLKAGVPKEAIIVEKAATNTLENVRFGMAKLKSHEISVRSALLVGKNFLMRRSIATFAKQFQSIHVLACPPCGGISQALDRSTEAFAVRLVAEVERLDRYSRKGDISRLQIPESIRAAVTRIRKKFDIATPVEIS
jgi:uncharacterized SAM-binding protein YcdF (DUF218 family)